MSTMNVSLPDELKSYVDEQVGDGGYGSTSEYVRDLSVATRTVNSFDATSLTERHRRQDPSQILNLKSVRDRIRSGA